MNPNVASLFEKYGWIIALLLIVIFYKVVLRVFFGAVIIAKEEIGIVNKRWVCSARTARCPTAPSSPSTAKPACRPTPSRPASTSDSGLAVHRLPRALHHHRQGPHRHRRSPRRSCRFPDGRVLAPRGGLQLLPGCARVPRRRRRARPADLHHPAGHLPHQHRALPGVARRRARNPRQHGRRRHHQGRQAAAHRRDRRAGGRRATTSSRMPRPSSRRAATKACRSRSSSPAATSSTRASPLSRSSR